MKRLREFLAEAAVVLLWAAVALHADRSLAANPTPTQHGLGLDVATVAMPTMQPSPHLTERR
jgi:hypothetical protein